MDRGINASFIPKKDIQSRQRNKTPLAANLFLLIAVIIFLTALLASLAVFLWGQQLDAANSRALEDLQRNRDSYGISAIEEFIDINNRIKAADSILSNHVNVSEIFALLEEDTLTDIYLSGFTFTTQGSEVFVESRGNAPTYAHVALQADRYGENNNIKGLLLTGVNQAREGGIQFDLSFSVDRDLFIINR